MRKSGLFLGDFNGKAFKYPYNIYFYHIKWVLGHVRCQMMLSDLLEVEVNEHSKGFKKCYEYELVCSLEQIKKPAIVSKDGITGIMMNKSTISFGGNPLLGKFNHGST